MAFRTTDDGQATWALVATILFEQLADDVRADRNTPTVLTRELLADRMKDRFRGGYTQSALAAAPTRIAARFKDDHFAYFYPPRDPKWTLTFKGPTQSSRKGQRSRSPQLFITHEVKPFDALASGTDSTEGLVDTGTHQVSEEPSATPAPQASSWRESLPHIAPSRLFWGKNIGPDSLIGRENEIQVLDAAWLGPKRKQVVTIVAWGGVGKTSVVAHWSARKLSQPEHGAIDAYFDWSFYSQGTFNESDSSHARKAVSADLFFKAALEFFGDPQLASSNASATRKAERLAQLVGNCRSLVTLDGLESLQDSTTGELLDDGVRFLLRGLAAHNQGLCLVTTRKHLPELNTWRETTALELELAKLTKADGARLLENLGVMGTPKELELLTEDLKGHALTLTLLGKYLVEAHNGDIRKRDTVSLTEADYAESSGHAFRVIEAYERWFENDGCHEELELLRLLGLFDRPATPDCLAALRQAPAIPALTDLLSTINDAHWNQSSKRLIRLGLIESQPWEPPRVVGYTKERVDALREPHQNLGEPVPLDMPHRNWNAGAVVDTHPLIREFFVRRLRGTEAGRAAHNRLFEHLQASVPYWPEGLDGLQPLYQAVSHGCEAGRYGEAIQLFFRRINRGGSPYTPAYPTRELGAVGTELAAANSFFIELWSRPVPELSEFWQAWLLNHAGFHLCALGRLTDAREPLRMAVERFGRLSLSNSSFQILAVKVASNLSHLDLTLGNIDAAIGYAKQGIEFADRSREVASFIESRARCANALHQAGLIEETGRLFKASEAQMSRSGAAHTLLYSMWGFLFCDFLLADIERLAWQAMLRCGSEFVSTETSDHLQLLHDPEAKRRRARLPAASEQAWKKLSAAHRRAAAALPLAQRSGTLIDIALAHLVLAREEIYSAILDRTDLPSRFYQSLTHLVPALDYLRQSGDQDWLGAGLLTQALSRVAQGRVYDARLDLDEALYIAKRGPMPLRIADVYLCRARLLFVDDLEAAKSDLQQARTLIERHGYLRRLPELADAEKAILPR